MQLSEDKQQVSDNIFMVDDLPDKSSPVHASASTHTSMIAQNEQKQRPVTKNYQQFDFSTLVKVSDIDIPFFNRLSDLLSVVFPQQMKERFNIRIEAESLKSRVVPYSHFTQTLADDTFVVQSQCLTWNTNLLVSFSRKAVNQGLNQYLNSGSSAPTTSNVDRPLSRMGEQFAQSVANCCFTSINKILNQHLSLNMLTRYVENNVEKAVLVDGREKVMICTINVSFGDNLSRPINIVLPLVALTPFLPELERVANILAGQLEEPLNGRNTNDSIQQISFDLVATTGEEQVPLKTITNLKVGDFLALPGFDQLHLKVLDDVIFKASLGNDGAFHAGKIEKVEYKIQQEVEGNSW